MALYVDVEKSFGRFRLRIQLEAEREVLGLLGCSGCGKSMTLRCVAGLTRPDRGRIVLNGRTLFDSEHHINLPPQQRRVGYLFQNYALFPNMTAWQNMMTGARRSGKRREAEARIRALVKRFELEGLEEHMPAQLSGGQRQRVALVRMLVSEPEILMLDEPFSALDSYLRWQLERCVAQVSGTFSGTTLFVSHDRDEVYRLCDNIAVLSDGRVEQCAPRDVVFEKPRTYTAALLTGCKNLSAAEVRDGALWVPAWNLMLRTAGPPTSEIRYAGIRAHFFTLSEPEACNAFACCVEECIESPFSRIVMVRPAGAEALLRWEADKTETRGMQEGDRLHLRIAPENVLSLYG